MLISALFSLPFGQARFECIVAAYLGAHESEAPCYLSLNYSKVLLGSRNRILSFFAGNVRNVIEGLVSLATNAIKHVENRPM